ncbi:MAG: hypothetical protein HYY24_23215 [Verrucomicrobia bacterium]|nr:hypothetical protein [Verrucomicrobiota bacterium]
MPNAPPALVAREKITDYLLNAAPPDNRGKAEFFAAVGVRRGHGEVRARVFRKLARDGDVTERLESAHGTKYVLEARWQAPAARHRPCGRSGSSSGAGIDRGP